MFSGPVAAVAFSPNSDIIFSAGGTLHILPHEGPPSTTSSLRLWPGGCIHGICLLPKMDTRDRAMRFAVFGQRQAAILSGVECTQLTVEREYTLPDWIYCATLVPLPGCSNLELAFGLAHNLVEAFPANSVSSIRFASQSRALLYSMAMHVQGSLHSPLVAAGTVFNEVHLWNLWDGAIRCRLTGHEGSIYRLAFSPSGEHLISASDDRTLRLWSTVMEQCTSVLQGHTCRVWDCVLLEDATGAPRPVSCGEDQRCVVWDKDGRPARRFEDTGSAGAGMWCLAVSPDEQLCATGGNDGTVKIWPLRSAASPETEGVSLSVPEGSRVRAMAIDAKLLLLYAATDSGVLQFRFGEGAPTTALVVPGGPVPNQLAASGGILAAGHANGRVCLFLNFDGPSPIELPAFNESIFFVQFETNSESTFLWVASPLGKLQAYTVRPSLEETPTIELVMPSPRNRTACVLRLGGFVVVGDVLGCIHIYAPTSELLHSWSLHKNKRVAEIWPLPAVSGFAFSSSGFDGSIVVVSCLDPSAPAEATVTPGPRSHAHAVGALVAVEHDDGHGLQPRLLVGFRAHELVVWDATAGCDLVTLSYTKRELCCAIIREKYWGTAWVANGSLRVAGPLFNPEAPKPTDSPCVVGERYHGREVHSVQLLRNTHGLSVLSCSEDTTLSLRHILPDDGKPVFNSRGPPLWLQGAHPSSVRCAVVCPTTDGQGSLLIACGGQEVLSAWVLAADKSTATLIYKVALSDQRMRDVFHPELSELQSCPETEADDSCSSAEDEDPENKKRLPRLTHWERRQLRERNNLHFRALSVCAVPDDSSKGANLVFVGSSDSLIKVLHFPALLATGSGYVPRPVALAALGGPVLSMCGWTCAPHSFVFAGTTSGDLHVFGVPPHQEPGDKIGAVPQLAVLAKLHNSAINSCTICAVPGNEGFVVVVTGGDDQAVAASLWSLESEHPTRLAVDFCEGCHAAGVRSVAICWPFAFSVSDDQRLLVFKIRVESTVLRILRELEIPLDVAHPSSVSALPLLEGGETVCVAVAGQGLQVVTTDGSTWE
eukprot:TRINITY_DN13901_c0_g1_i1.p1 TRINITY_DN13901_c0_g1~~TRINITY_DN13901_c0_g1_i1.p1  ORF type:complete len:1052 (+),score=94.26 TRINITY_DN13901_c0_g1_i1:40-3195(+)